MRRAVVSSSKLSVLARARQQCTACMSSRLAAAVTLWLKSAVEVIMSKGGLDCDTKGFSYCWAREGVWISEFMLLIISAKYSASVFVWSISCVHCYPHSVNYFGCREDFCCVCDHRPVWSGAFVWLVMKVRWQKSTKILQDMWWHAQTDNDQSCTFDNEAMCVYGQLFSPAVLTI